MKPRQSTPMRPTGPNVPRSAEPVLPGSGRVQGRPLDAFRADLVAHFARYRSRPSSRSDS